MGALSIWHWLIVLAVVLLLFGSKKLPDAARGLGRSMRIFKSEIKEMQNDGAEEKSETQAITQGQPSATQYVQPQAQQYQQPAPQAPQQPAQPQYQQPAPQAQPQAPQYQQPQAPNAPQQQTDPTAPYNGGQGQ
ncbi:MAG: Sec-independent protein translocase subunit TatA [Actinomycetales bacterium]|nr:Sec-independent protein translocase subunit TatA [Actinomycetales bacterium]